MTLDPMFSGYEPGESPCRHPLDLLPTSELISALERRFDTLVFAGTILLTDGPTGKEEQRVVRVKGHDLIQAGLVQLLLRHCQPPMLPAVKVDGGIGGQE